MLESPLQNDHLCRGWFNLVEHFQEIKMSLCFYGAGVLKVGEINGINIFSIM
jgi:hypothetical protein